MIVYSADLLQDNTNHAFLQYDDGVLVYRGADQPDMSVINPESDVWQSIKVRTQPRSSVFTIENFSQIPAAYNSNAWPIRYACISSDARLIAVAGRRGFTHYNSLSGRWKIFENEKQEQSVRVQGGMQWYGSTLVAGIEEESEDGEQTIYKVTRSSDCLLTTLTVSLISAMSVREGAASQHGLCPRPRAIPVTDRAHVPL